MLKLLVSLHPDSRLASLCFPCLSPHPGTYLQASHLRSNPPPLPKPFLPVRLCHGLKLCPRKRYVEVLTCGCDLLWKQSLWMAQGRWGHMGFWRALIWWLGSFGEEEKRHQDQLTQREQAPRGYRGWDWSAGSPSQGTPRMPSSTRSWEMGKDWILPHGL